MSSSFEDCGSMPTCSVAALKMLLNMEKSEPAATTPVAQLVGKVEISRSPRKVCRKLSSKSLLLKLAEEKSSISFCSLRDSCRLPLLEQFGGNKNCKGDEIMDHGSRRKSDVPGFINVICAPPVYHGTIGSVSRAA